MSKKETIAVHTVLPDGQGAHRRDEVKQTNRKKKERMKKQKGRRDTDDQEKQSNETNTKKFVT